jgi:DNA-binding SARP family transcriptional activator
LAEGNASEAIRAYRDYRAVLSDEIGIKPSSAMEDLVRPMRWPADLE